MQHGKKLLSAVMSALLVVSLMGAPAWASDGQKATVNQVAADALGFLYVESPIVSVGESENIVVGLTDEDITIESATLEATRASDGDTLSWSAVKHVDNTALFTVAFASDDSIGGYLLHGVSYTAGGVNYRIDFDAVSLVEASEVLEVAQDGGNATTQEIIEECDEVSEESAAVYAFEVVSAELDATLASADAIASASESGTVAFAVSEDGSLEATPSVAEAIEVSDNAVESDEGQGYSAAAAVESLFGVEKAYASSNGNLVVALDPGHGGSDPGACANGLQEKDVNLKIAQYCKSALETYSGVEVYMTRTTDEYVGLQERVDRSVANGADVIVSIHCNAGGGSGAEVWVPNESSWCYQETHVTGYELGSKILNKITALGIGYRGVYTRDCTSGDEYEDGSLMDYYTIISASRENGIPGIIVEHAFIDNESEAASLASDSFLQQLGQADAEGIAEQYGLTSMSYENVKGFVVRLYTEVLGRDYDEDGLNTWVNAITHGMGAAAAAQGFFNSDEFAARGLSNEDIVETAYATFLDREPDSSGLEHWTGMLDDGMSTEAIVVGFGNSAEFRDLCAQWGVSAGSVSPVRNEARDANRNVTAFVSRLYTQVLGRAYDVGGLNSWCAYINAGSGAGSAAQGFFNSDEFAARGLSNEDIVETAYITMLDRESDAAGKENWVSCMNAGMPVSLLVSCFANSEEFRNLCSEYGVNAGSVPYDASAVALYSGQNIMGASQTTVAQMVRRYNAVGCAYPTSAYASKGAEDITAFCEILYEEANAEGVRAEIVFAQAMHETGWLQFEGDVSVDQCNFCGLGATGGGVSGNSFDDVRTGLRAQVQHLKAYASTDALNNACVDPRFDYVTRGCATTLNELSGTWASDSNYGTELMGQVKELLAS